MDNKTVYVRTSKGEDEVHSRTMHLPGDIKRALLMIDGIAAYGEISKRAAPSLRAGLEAMLQELEKDGYIVDKAKSGNIHKAPEHPKTFVPPKMSAPPKMSVPPKMVTPHKIQQENEGAGDLDFMSGFGVSPSKAPPTGPDEDAAEAGKLKAEAEAIAKQEVEAAKLRAQQEAEAILHKAEQEAARIREEAEREKQQAAFEIHAREEAARRAKEEAESARLKAEQAVKARLEAETKALQQAEAARKKAEQEAAIAHEAAERIAKQERELAKAREEAEKRARQETVAKATVTPPAAKPDTFAFDAFHIDEPQPATGQRVVDQPAQKTSPAATAPAAKPDTFAFGEFHIDELQPLVKPLQVEQPVQKASPAELAQQPKRDTFSFDSFKIEIPEPPKEPPAKEKEYSAQQPGDAARATQHAETRQPVHQEAPPAVASKPVGDTPSQEEIKRATQERIETEKRIKEEALAAKKHAEDQAKALAEAEQRKAEAARAEFEQVVKHDKYSFDAAPETHAVKPAPVARVRRKPFSLGRLVGFMLKLGVFLLVLLVGALFVVPYALPTRDYMPIVEKLLSEKLHQPVHIGRLSGRILPAPCLELGEIYFGEVKQLQVEQALINFAFTGLFIEAKPIDSIELQGVKVSGAGLQNVSAWLQQLAADKQYPVARMVISGGILDADVIQFTGVEGVLDFNKFGEFSKANLRSNGGKYALDVNAASGSKLQVAISVRGSALPLLPGWPFDELAAKGELRDGELSIGEFEGRIHGGVLQGNASINWRSDWVVQGAMSAKTIALQRMNNLLEGNVEGSARFKMTAVDLAGLADSAMLDGNFISKNGLISGIDIVETARSRSKEHLPGGRTHFDELSGAFIFSNNILHLKQTKVATGALNAVITLDIDKKQLSGTVIAKLKLQEAMKPVELKIEGATDRPTLRFAP